MKHECVQGLSTIDRGEKIRYRNMRRLLLEERKKGVRDDP